MSRSMVTTSRLSAASVLTCAAESLTVTAWRMPANFNSMCSGAGERSLMVRARVWPANPSCCASISKEPQGDRSAGRSRGRPVRAVAIGRLRRGERTCTSAPGIPAPLGSRPFRKSSKGRLTPGRKRRARHRRQAKAKW